MAMKEAALEAVLQTLKKAYGGPDELDEARPLDQLILLILSRSIPIAKARLVMRRLRAEYVDWNEVRVSGVYEIKRTLSPIGVRKSGQRAAEIRDLLGTVYNRFNKLSLDFLNSEEPDRVRQRERFEAYLLDRSPALAQMLSFLGPHPADIPIAAGLPKVLGRLRWLSSSRNTVASARRFVATAIGDVERPAVLWRLHLLLEEACLVRDPRCSKCPVLSLCPTGKAAMEAKKAAEKARAKKKAPAKKAAKKAPAKKASAKKAAKKASAKKAAATKKASASKKKTSKT